MYLRRRGRSVTLRSKTYKSSWDKSSGKISSRAHNQTPTWTKLIITFLQAVVFYASPAQYSQMSPYAGLCTKCTTLKGNCFYIYSVSALALLALSGLFKIHRNTLQKAAKYCNQSLSDTRLNYWDKNYKIVEVKFLHLGEFQMQYLELW